MIFFRVFHQNESSACLSVYVGVVVITGRTNAAEEILPLDHLIVQIGLIPTKTGYLQLPKFEITSETSNASLLNPEERRELFVLPRDHASWRED